MTNGKTGMITRAGLTVGSAAMVLFLTTGCSTKHYVRAQAAPVIQNANELDARTAADHRNIVNTDEKATAGIASAQSAADAAGQHATAAGQSADKAQGSAQDAYHRVDSLAGTVAGLDNYKSVQDVSVTFGFDKAALTSADKKQLDELATSLGSQRHFILELTGGTDSVGDAQYNYALSQKRADAVALYLQSKYNVAPHKFYMVGIGKDQEVATNRTATGRKQNRRVQVRVLSNLQDDAQTPSAGQ